MVIVQEVIHSMNLSHSNKWMVWKVDLAKAYDQIRWEFLKDVLVQVGLSSFLIEVIMASQSRGKTRLLWHGEEAGDFSPSRGVRQDDPLSAIKDGLWKPISIGGVELSHLLFADDLVLFAEASPTQAMVIKHCLENFCDLSRELVNFSKSSLLFADSVEIQTQELIRDIVEILVVVDFECYLGVPMGRGQMSIGCYHFLLDKVKSRLRGWQAQTLSFAGRVMLVNSVLTSMPIYTMQTMAIPNSICNDIDKTIRGFVWGSSNECRRIHLLPIETVTKPWSEGGLGIRPMKQTNSAILVKLGWRAVQEPNSLWSPVIRGKYGRGRADIDMFTKLPTMSRTWKGLVEGAPLLSKGIRKAIGNDKSTLF